MGINPVPVAIICTVAYGFQALILATGAVDISASQPDCSIGGLDFLQDLAECAADVGRFLFQFFGFTLVGMPWYIGSAIAVACPGTMIWAFAQLIRGS